MGVLDHLTASTALDHDARRHILRGGTRDRVVWGRTHGASRHRRAPGWLRAGRCVIAGLVVLATPTTADRARRCTTTHDQRRARTRSRPPPRRRRRTGAPRAQRHAAGRLRRREGDRRRHRGDLGRLRARRHGVRRPQDRRDQVLRLQQRHAASSSRTHGRPTSPTSAAKVNNYWDRGLTGIALDPQFGTAGHNFVYVNYTYNRDPRDARAGGARSGATRRQRTTSARPRRPTDPPRSGCVAMMRVTRLTAVKARCGWVMSRQRAAAARRAAASSSAATPPATWSSARTASSTPRPVTVRASTPGLRPVPQPVPGDPANEGGSLRVAGLPDARRPARRRRHDRPDGPGQPGSRPHRRTREPAGWSPTASATRGGSPSGPGTNELWSGDVGGSTWEEINRIPDVTTVDHAGQPRLALLRGRLHRLAAQQGWDALDQPICENLYAAGRRAPCARRTSATRPGAPC